jgi:hypothetical protein
MAAISLNRMSVAGSDGGSGNQGLLMPKLQYRFRVKFLNFGVDTLAGLSLTRQIVDVARPTVQFDQVTLPVYNSTVKLAGKHQWTDITCTIRDEATGEVAKAVGQQLQKQLDFMEQASAAAGQDYKFQTNIEILDGGNGTAAPAVLETWELYGCWLRTANYQTLNYGQSDAVTIQLTICYDNALQTPLGSGVGAPIGRLLSGSLASGVGTTT